jgi:hypothetical protein
MALSEQFDVTVESMKVAYIAAYDSYKKMLDAGVAREVARAAFACCHLLIDVCNDECSSIDELFIPSNRSRRLSLSKLPSARN